jgi:hypothetical protein
MSGDGLHHTTGMSEGTLCSLLKEQLLVSGIQKLAKIGYTISIEHISEKTRIVILWSSGM